jgi:hypothetical protein
MTGPILITALGIVVLAIGIHALAKGSFYGNLYRVTRESMPYQFYYSVVLDLIGGSVLVVIGSILLRQELK